MEDKDLVLHMYDAIAKWREELLSTKHKMVYNLVPGKLVIFDNWRMLHGREKFKGRRTLCGAYQDRQLFLSRLSVLKNEQTDKF